MKAVLYYRGTLSSCNYDCPYCPFSKHIDSKETLARDRSQLEKFMSWVRVQGKLGHRLSVFFNPYGEALLHRWYREAMIELSGMKHIDKITVQTNLSVKLDWTSQLNPEKVSFWASYHPGQTEESRFVAQCMELYNRGLRFSVGSVGVRSAFEPIDSLRRALPEDVYLWINAFKDNGNRYTVEEIDLLASIDPYFRWNIPDYESLGKSCQTGSQVFYVQGSGQVKRCYQDRKVIGNLYRDGLEGLSQERACGMGKCGCYIGYIHMPELQLDNLYGEGLLERNPQLLP
ncbi:STM4011 family radical SAM protein [Paenibacillus sp. GCM10012307]|uniref:Radical SAM protein n=1 Tax=Paenibacillus roseus TaxID=2798579 RepID=A0A934MRV6_9BACL|nr:STM4011 family radical SAM protein [Paenibacillus roseus]MBJ6362709.1 radical SAM protein [Paenibacillus roseus]